MEYRQGCKDYLNSEIQKHLDELAKLEEDDTFFKNLIFGCTLDKLIDKTIYQAAYIHCTDCA